MRASADRALIAQPGVNCWRVDRAHRFYCIQDAANYFRLVREAMLRARHTVFILGWDTMANTNLLPGETCRRRSDNARAAAEAHRPPVAAAADLSADLGLCVRVRVRARSVRPAAFRMADAAEPALFLRRPPPDRRLAPSEGGGDRR